MAILNTTAIRKRGIRVDLALEEGQSDHAEYTERKRHPSWTKDRGMRDYLKKSKIKKGDSVVLFTRGCRPVGIVCLLDDAW